jgi:hypothetical protein
MNKPQKARIHMIFFIIQESFNLIEIVNKNQSKKNKTLATKSAFNFIDKTISSSLFTF